MTLYNEESISALGDPALLKLVGERVAGIRLGRNMSQQYLAKEAGVGLRTVQRLEGGEHSIQLDSFLRVCRVLDLLGRLDLFLPEPEPSPIDLLNRQQKTRRQRASGTREHVAEDPGPWVWGDDK